MPQSRANTVIYVITTVFCRRIAARQHQRVHAESTLTANALHEDRRRDDRNIAEGIEREQIAVTADDQIRR